MNNFRRFWIAGLLALVILGVGLGVWWFISDQSSPAPTEGEPTPTTEAGVVIPPATTDCADELDVACWQTYRNEQYGFEFRFPQDFNDTKKINFQTDWGIMMYQWTADSNPWLYYNLILSKITDQKITLSPWSVTDQDIRDIFDFHKIKSFEKKRVGDQVIITVLGERGDSYTTDVLESYAVGQVAAFSLSLSKVPPPEMRGIEFPELSESTQKIFKAITNSMSFKISICDMKPTGTAIGRDIYPTDTEKYGDIGFLGELFTADDCGPERVQKLFGVQGNYYSLKPDIGLNDAPSAELHLLLKDIGFIPGDNCLNTLEEKCGHWTMIKDDLLLRDILRLKPYVQEIKSSGCLNCG